MVIFIKAYRREGCALIPDILFEVFFIDARTLLAVLFWENLATVLIILGIRTLSFFSEKRELVNQMMLIRILYTFGYLMLFYRGMIPDFFSSNLGNIILYAGFYLKNQIFCSMLGLYTKRLRNVMLVTVSVSMIAYNLQELLYGTQNSRIVVASLAIFGMFVVPTVKILISKASTPFNYMVGIFYLMITVAVIPRFFTALYDASFSIHTVNATQTLLYLGLLLECHGGMLFFFLFLKIESDEEIAKLASTDSMTGLVNRMAFLARGKEIFEIGRKKEESVALLFLDVDEFKRINDRFGHGVGDEVLIKFGEALIRSTRTGDICCRYGGDEFLVLLQGASGEIGIHVAKRIIRELAEIIVAPDAPEVKVASSIGVVFGIPKEEETLDKFIGIADKVMYKAKNSGSNQIFICDNIETEKLEHIKQ